MWNDEIRNNIIKELKEQFSNDVSDGPEEQSDGTVMFPSPTFESKSSLYRAFSPCIETPSYHETIINKTRKMKEIPIHTIAFSDTFNQPSEKKAYRYEEIQNEREVIYDMSTLFKKKAESTIVFPVEGATTEPKEELAAETSLAQKFSWTDTFLRDIPWSAKVPVWDSFKKFCNIQIEITY